MYVLYMLFIYHLYIRIFTGFIHKIAVYLYSFISLIPLHIIRFNMHICIGNTLCRAPFQHSKAPYAKVHAVKHGVHKKSGQQQLVVGLVGAGGLAEELQQLLNG